MLEGDPLGTPLVLTQADRRDAVEEHWTAEDAEDAEDGPNGTLALARSEI
jgi:hypothetical protein